MNNGRPALALLVACVLLLITLDASRAQESSGAYDLSVTAIESQPFAAGIGDETKYYVTLENMLASPLPPQLMLDLYLTVTNAQTKETIAECRQPVDLALMAEANSPLRVTITDCSVVLQDPGTHLVRAELTETGLEPAQGAFALIPGDLNPGNNGAVSTIVPVVVETDDNLPTELTRIFAGLAIFFAVMALVAAGAEVAIDSLKVAVGLKRKVTSMDALERMEQYLPGELGALSVSATTQEQFQRMIREMRSALGGTLRGIESIAVLREQIAGGEFGSTFQRANQLSRAHETLSSKELYNYKKYLQAYVTNVLNTLENRLHLSAAAIQPLRDQLAQEISLFDGEHAQEFLADLIGDMQDPHFWSTQIVDGWLNSKKDIFFTRNSAAVVEEYDNEVKPLLLGVGFEPDSIESLKLEIVTRIGIIEAGMSQSTDTFLASIRNVLDAVEMRRYDTQSPSRKVWRKLRGWQGGVFPPTRLRSMLIPALFLALCLLHIAWMNHMTESPAFGGVLERTFSGLNGTTWFSWYIVFLIVALLGLLSLYYARRSVGAEEKLWFTGLYGASALSLLTSAFLTLLLWVLQPMSANRVTGELVFFDWIQPWWSWLVLFALTLLALMLSASLIGRTIYDRLVRSAVRDGRLRSDRNALGNATVIHRVETLWNLLRQGFDVTRVDPDRFDQPDTVLDYEAGIHSNEGQPFVFSPDTAAQFIMQRSDQQRDEETSRLRVLRVMSIAIGLALAYALQIDVLALLGEAFPDILNQLNWTIVSGETLHAWRSWLPVDKSITVGIVLTAFAASAGSAFWHDRLDQLQASKKGAQAAAQLLNQASQVADTTKRG